MLRHLGRLIVSPKARANALHERRRRRRGEPAFPAGPIRRVVIICLGNICRSPFAGELLASLRPSLSVRSRGLAAGEGAPAEPAALRVAARFGIDLSSHQARLLVADDVLWADLILAMEGHHLASLARDWPRQKLEARLLGDFLPEPPFTIRDPWGQSDDFFELTFQRIADAVGRLSLRLEAKGSGCPGGS